MNNYLFNPINWVDQASKFGISALNQGTAKLKIAQQLKAINGLVTKIFDITILHDNKRNSQLENQLINYNSIKMSLKTVDQNRLNKFFNSVLLFNCEGSNINNQDSRGEPIRIDLNIDLIDSFLDANAIPDAETILKILREFNECPRLEDLVRAGFPYWTQNQKISFIASIWHYNMHVFDNYLPIINFEMSLKASNLYLFDKAIMQGRTDIVNRFILCGAQPTEEDLKFALIGTSENHKDIAERIQGCLEKQKAQLLRHRALFKSLCLDPTPEKVKRAKRKICTNLLLWPATFLPKAVKAAIAMKDPKFIDFLKMKLLLVINRYDSIIPDRDRAAFIKCANLLGDKVIIDFISDREKAQ